MSILRLTVVQGRPWDQVGIGASLVCVGHCLATPLLIVFLPVVELVERQTHAAFALSILAAGLLAFAPAYREHRRRGVVVMACAGFAMIAAGAVAPEGLVGETVETWLTVIGGVTLITAHLRNAYFCRHCGVCRQGRGAAEPGTGGCC
jgi:hypothetical protein